MSHKATSWLEDLDCDSMTAGAFRILFHLCCAHNSHRPSNEACFPSQKRLMERTKMSNGGLNKGLNQLESLGLIRRIQTRKSSGVNGPTYYILGFDLPKAQEPTPQSGATTNSTKWSEPTPQNGALSLHPSGDEQVIEPVKKKEPPISPKPDRFEEFWSVVPRRVAKDKARAAWLKAIKRADAGDVIDGMRRYAATRDGQDPQFTAHPASWLNAGRWQDEVDASPQDFHNMISQALGGPDAISGPRESDHGQTQRLPAPLQAPGASGPERGADRATGNGGGDERAYPDIIRPRRFGSPR